MRHYLTLTITYWRRYVFFAEATYHTPLTVNQSIGCLVFVLYQKQVFNRWKKRISVLILAVYMPCLCARARFEHIQ